MAVRTECSLGFQQAWLHLPMHLQIEAVKWIGPAASVSRVQFVLASLA